MPALHKSDALFLAGILLTAAVLLFTRLDDRSLWQDEAETALLAESVLRVGVPTAFDGRNLISQEGGQEFNPPDYTWSWTPWLQHYTAAASFALLGPSTFSARLPFVLFGLATLWLCYRLGEAVGGDRHTARLGALVLLASVPFLLHMRQCRYYAPLCFFGVLLVLEYVRFVQGRKRAHWGMASAVVGLFHSHYVVCAGLLLGLALHFALLVRDRQKWGPLARAAGVALLLTAPFVLRFAANVQGQALPGLEQAASKLHDAVFHLNRFVFPAALLLVLGGLWAMQSSPDDAGESPSNDETQTKPVWQRAAPIVFASLACSLTLIVTMPWFFFRYYVVLIPLCAVLQAIIIVQAWRWSPVVGIGLAGLLIFTDVLPRALPMQQHIPRSSALHVRTGDETSGQVVNDAVAFVPMAAYLHEISHDSVGPIEAAVKVLGEHARADETIVATYGDLPLQFYTDLHVVGGLSGVDPRPWTEADWLFIRTQVHRAGDRRLKQFLIQQVDFDQYESIQLGVLDRPFEQRPDPTTHKFRAPSRNLQPAQLYRRRVPAAETPDA